MEMKKFFSCAFHIYKRLGKTVPIPSFKFRRRSVSPNLSEFFYYLSLSIYCILFTSFLCLDDFFVSLALLFPSAPRAAVSFLLTS